MILNVILFLLIVVLTVAVALWFTIDYQEKLRKEKERADNIICPFTS